MINFGKPSYLFLFWLIPALLIFYLWTFRMRKQLLERFVSPSLESRLISGIKSSTHKISALFILATVFFIIFALIGPQWGFHWEELRRRGSDIIIAVDISKSMLVQDIKPNRLERARREIIDLLGILKGDRVGLVLFSGTSFTYCPLTLDYSALRLFLDDLSPDLISTPGTAIGSAIETSLKSFSEGDAESQAIILITDGEDLRGNSLKAAQKAKAKGIRIYTIGIGKIEGAPIPDEKSGGFKKNRQGEIVLSHLDETTLQKIALITGGAYVRSVTGDLDLENIYKAIQKDIQIKELTGGAIKRYKERYQWFLALAFIFIVIESLLSAHLGNSIGKKIFLHFHKGKTSLIIFLIIGIIFFYVSDSESFIDRAGKGKKLYEEKKYDEALSYYLDKQIDSPDNPALSYNTASSYYKLKKYKEAEKLFQASSQAQDKELVQKSYYNLGNTSYRLGKLEEAVQYYKKALELNGDDKDAQYNLDYVLKELEKQKQQQNQQQQDREDKQKQNSQNQQQDNKSEDRKDNQQESSQEDKSSGQDNQEDKSSGQDNQEDKSSGQDNKENRGKKPHDMSDKEDKGHEESYDDNTRQEEEKDESGKGEQNNEKPFPSLEDNMNASQEAPQEGLTEQEASRWLSILKEERPPHNEGQKQRGAVHYPERDW